MSCCTVRWNPGRWPYVTRCELEHGHDGAHANGNDRLPQEESNAD